MYHLTITPKTVIGVELNQELEDNHGSWESNPRECSQESLESVIGVESNQELEDNHGT